MRSERKRFDGRTALAVRIRVLTRQYAAAVGDRAANPPMVAAIKRAAELTALAEQARADAVRNGVFDTVGLARIEGCADRARRALCLDAVPPPPVPPLSSYKRSTS
ncbi:MAG: hypothetical protein WAK55_18240 [Xanthobacteraceae bacterium]